MSSSSPASQDVAGSGSRALGWVFLGAAGRIAGQLVVQVSLARMLGPEAFGSFAAVVLLMGLGIVLADAGFGAALVHRPQLGDGDIRQALGWTLTLSLILAAAMWLAADTFARYMGNPELAPMCQMAALLLIPAAVRNIALNLTYRRLDFKGPQLIDFFGYTVCFGGVAITGAGQGWGAWSLLAGFAAQTLFVLVATYLRSPHPLRPRLRGDPSLAAFGLRALGNDVTNWLSESLDRLLIARLWGLHALGLFVVSTNLARAPVGMLMSSLRALAFSGSSRAQADRGALAGGMLLTVEAAALATLPAFAVVSVEAEAVLACVYGEKWREAAPIFQALAAAVPAIVLSTLLAAMLRGFGEIRTELRVGLATTAMGLLGLIGLSSWPLATAVWWFVFAATLRMAWLMVAACGALAVPGRALVAALRPAVMLAGLSATVCIAMRSSPWAAASATDLTPLFVGLVTTVSAGALGGRRYLSTGLQQWIRGAAGNVHVALRRRQTPEVRHGSVGDHAP